MDRRPPLTCKSEEKSSVSPEEPSRGGRRSAAPDPARESRPGCESRIGASPPSGLTVEGVEGNGEERH